MNTTAKVTCITRTRVFWMSTMANSPLCRHDSLFARSRCRGRSGLLPGAMGPFISCRNREVLGRMASPCRKGKIQVMGCCPGEPHVILPFATVLPFDSWQVMYSRYFTCALCSSFPGTWLETVLLKLLKVGLQLKSVGTWL